ncbi:putative nucleic-acid-binding protein [Flavobacterium sp. 2755]|uniref:PIN domain-containing protein n=1 Tax=Flavobacterium sp. 2755 TaxID=2817765 RepID=UPI00285A47C5|nr:PIN domain-containing protein [Flavobacterium sp. 2755]MDR6760167.1 putative nucleic-acid-binding protein [Flavobacterium sp. 2755]
MSEKNIFYLDEVFPEADKVFSTVYKSSQDIIKSGIIILDTNVLLIPYDTNEKNFIDIKHILEKYKKENRLFIPARVAREFANNRAKKIGDVFLKLRQLKESFNSGNFKLSKYPILDNDESYLELKNEFESIQKSIKKSRELIDNLESKIRSWNWDDNISLSYKEIFTSDIVIEVKKNKKDLEKDIKFRIDYKVSPGFKDSNKPDDGIGDLVIWQTILEIANDQGNDVIFVSNDQKNDWFYKQDKVGLYPKYELFDEFRRFTNGKSISIINFIDFLTLSEANDETIEEVKTTILENKNLALRDKLYSHLKKFNSGMIINHARFGKGKIINIKNSDTINMTLEIDFEEFGKKRLLARFANLDILEYEN